MVDEKSSIAELREANRYLRIQQAILLKKDLDAYISALENRNTDNAEMYMKEIQRRAKALVRKM